MSKITLREIADMLGISIGTVDRAIHNRPDVSVNTRQRVLEAIKNYGYKPDKVARSLSLKAKKKIIGVISKEKPKFFWDIVNNGIKAAENELVDFGVEIILRTYEEKTHESNILKIIDEFIEKKVNAIALVPKNIQSIRARIKQAIDNGVTVAAFNDDLTDTDRLFYVGPQTKQSGRIAAQLMGSFLKGSGKVLVLNADGGSWEYQNRFEGFIKCMKENYPHIEIVTYKTTLFEGEEVNEADFKKAIESRIPLDGIYNVDGATLYQVACVKNSIDRLNNCVIIGHEIWSNVNKFIDEGNITACISQDPFSQGYYVIRMLFDYLDERKRPKYERMYTRLDIVMKENFVNRDNIINPFYMGL